MTSPDYAARARSAKAARIRDHLLEELVRKDPARVEVLTFPGVVAGYTPEERLEATKAAGAHADSRPDDLPPSDETWDLVVAGVRRFVADASLGAEVEAAMAGSAA